MLLNHDETCGTSGEIAMAMAMITMTIEMNIFFAMVCTNGMEAYIIYRLIDKFQIYVQLFIIPKVY